MVNINLSCLVNRNIAPKRPKKAAEERERTKSTLVLDLISLLQVTREATEFRTN